MLLILSLIAIILIAAFCFAGRLPWEDDFYNQTYSPPEEEQLD